MKREKDITGFDYFKLVLMVILSFSLELFLAMVENIIYKQEVQAGNWTMISHWILICIIWSIVIYIILKYAITRYGFTLKDSKSKVSKRQGVIVIGIVLFFIVSKYIGWGGLKIVVEFNNLGIWKFLIQHLYYFFEAILFTLMIVFSQKSFEKWFKNERIPFGGIICSITWGLAHIMTQSSLAVGLFGAIGGFLFGTIYLILNRNLLKTFIVLFLMFIL